MKTTHINLAFTATKKKIKLQGAYMKTILTYDEVFVKSGGAIVRLENAEHYKVGETVKLIMLDDIRIFKVVSSNKNELELKFLRNS